MRRIIRRAGPPTCSGHGLAVVCPSFKWTRIDLPIAAAIATKVRTRFVHGNKGTLFIADAAGFNQIARLQLLLIRRRPKALGNGVADWGQISPLRLPSAARSLDVCGTRMKSSIFLRPSQLPVDPHADEIRGGGRCFAAWAFPGRHLIYRLDQPDERRAGQVSLADGRSRESSG